MLKNKLPKEINLLLSRKFDPKKGLWEIREIIRELRIELEAGEHCITEKEAKNDKVHRPVHLGFFNYTQTYLLGINKHTVLYITSTNFSTKLVRLSGVVMSTDSVEPVTAKKTKVRGGHQVHLRKLVSSANHLLRDTESAENNAELLSRKLQLERKAQIILK